MNVRPLAAYEKKFHKLFSIHEGGRFVSRARLWLTLSSTEVCSLPNQVESPIASAAATDGGYAY